ncbi:MAG: mRNA interferase YafO, partial [Phenylobacterium sp.]
QTYKFGKDVSYNRPQSAIYAELRHVHLVPISRRGNTSDRCLVYTSGFTDNNAFLLLAILEPNAHELSRSMLRMANLADIAEKFRNRF